MNDDERKALESIRLSWAPTPDDVWAPQGALHVGGLHPAALDEILRAYRDAKASEASSPLGVVVRGPAGSGKTHLLGEVREWVQQQGGFFFLIKLLDGQDFWRSILVGMLDDLSRPSPGYDSQLRMVLTRLAEMGGVDAADVAKIVGDEDIDPATLERFVRAVYTKHPRHRRRSQHVLRSLVLLASPDFDAQDVGAAFLQLDNEPGEDAFAHWGIKVANLGHQEVAENISRLLAMIAPTVLSLDQIDTLIANSGSDSPTSLVELEQVAHGLMSLRETLSRTVSVVSVITASWDVLEKYATASVPDRFRKPTILQRPTSPMFGRDMLAKRFALGYAECGFTPPYPSWPVNERAFADSVDFTPRELLRIADAHVARCLRGDSAVELLSLREVIEPSDTEKTIPDNELAELDQRFEDLRAAAVPGPALHHATEDEAVPPLLRIGIAVWIEQLGIGVTGYEQDPPPSPKPALHGRLWHVIDDVTDEKEFWAFRAISTTNAIGAQSRIRNATVMAGVGSSATGRTAVLLRTAPWPSGAKTTSLLAEFTASGGRVVDWTEDDVRTLIALSALKDEGHKDLAKWIGARKPASAVSFVAKVLDPTVGAAPAPVAGADTVTDSDTESEPVVTEPKATVVTEPKAVAPEPKTTADEPEPTLFTPQPAPALRRPAPTANVVDLPPSDPPANDIAPTTLSASAPAVVPLGKTVESGREVSVDLEALRKHTAIFAGSGSGKTVLIRRIVEECALQGVSAIVLDINNDLARLGVEWPSPPSAWAAGDADKARDYLAGTEVVVFTPGLASGRPLSFQPLPDFAEVRDNDDEFTAAVESAAAGLIPRAMVAGKTAKHVQSQAVLKEALRYFGRRGGGSITDFIDVLADLPDGVSGLSTAHKHAADMAENLKAARANDSLFGGSGTAADPGVLLTPTPGRKARVSVINLSALTTEDARTNFVNELQMALFAWIKKNPAGDRPLGGLFVMDEAQNFAPSDRVTACSRSTLALVSQARKFGLGLVFATQAPKGLDAKIPGNCATQFYGMLNSPVHIQAAQEIARSKGSTIPDVGRLSTGVFYVALEGHGFSKIQTPLCLSYHPKSPPTEDEVAAIARRGPETP